MIEWVAWCALLQVASPLLTPEESKGVDAVVESAVAAGFPDAAGSEVHFGTLEVISTVDPEKEPGPFPTVSPIAQEPIPGSPRRALRYSFYGLHFRLSDGSWIIELAYRYRPQEGDRIDVSNGPRLDLGGLTAAASGILPFHARKEASAWLDRVVPAQRARLAFAMDLMVPVTFRLKLRAEDFAPAVLLLYRAGWPDAASATLSIADQRARVFGLVAPWTPGAGPFDPTGVYAKLRDEESAWKASHPQVELEPPPAALRRAIFMWSAGQILADHALLEPDTAAAVARGAVDPGDPQHFRERIEALRAASQLPIVPADSADLAARLASWESRPRMPRIRPPSDPALSTGELEPLTTAYTPRREDEDGLVALLGDARPSRFVDPGGPRTVGDNAWRAIAQLLQADPRTLAEIPTDRPWTDAERRSAAGAFATWWKAHRGQYAGR